MEVAWVDHAMITPIRTGEMRLADRQQGWMTGAVYDAGGGLLPQSQRVRLAGGHWWPPVSVDPARTRLPKAQAELDGRWVFAGHWYRHFGHFLLETLPTLWPSEEVASVRGIVAIPNYQPSPGAGRDEPVEEQLEVFQSDLLDLAGVGDRPVMLSRQSYVRVEQLLVAGRPVVSRGYVRPEAVAMWRRISQAVPARGAGRKVLMSRSRFNAVHGAASDGPLRTDPDWDARVDRAFAAAGFDIVFPEELSIRQQIAVVRGAQVLAGSAGSALHLSCFAEPGTKVLELGDRRSGRRRSPNQRAIDAACGHLVDVLPYGDLAALDQLELLAGEGFRPARAQSSVAQSSVARSTRRALRDVMGRRRFGSAAGNRSDTE